MSYACPSCSQKGISFFRKWLSFPAVPAKCKSCGAYSFAQRSSGGAGLVVSATALTLLGFLAIYLKSALPFLVGGILVIIFYLRHWHKVRLELIPVEVVQAARKAEAVSGVTWLLLIFFN